VLAVLAWPAVALAAVVQLHGPVGSGANDAVVDMSAVIKHGKAVKVTRFTWANVPVSCTGGPTFATAVSDEFPRHMKVSRKGNFHGTVKVNGGRTTYTVTGHFKSRHKAKGTLHISGVVPQCLHADSGILHWSAK
jgi:uncharacterized protein (DUF2147 family)